MKITHIKLGSQVAVGDVLGTEKCWMGQTAYPEPEGMVFNNAVKVTKVVPMTDTNYLKCTTELLWGECDCEDKPLKHRLYLDKRWYIFETPDVYSK